MSGVGESCPEFQAQRLINQFGYFRAMDEASALMLDAWQTQDETVIENAIAVSDAVKLVWRRQTGAEREADLYGELESQGDAFTRKMEG